MPEILKDSSSLLEPHRQWPQLQALAVHIYGRCDNPETQSFRWLDLGAGQGQILKQLKSGQTGSALNKISYFPLDAREEYLRTAVTNANDLRLREVKSYCGLLQDLDRLLENNAKFDLITLTNVLHELNPFDVPGVIFGAIQRLAADGASFCYDMQLLDPPELGALPWRTEDIRILLRALFATLGSTYEPTVLDWQHTKVRGWSFLVDRQYPRLSSEQMEEGGRAWPAHARLWS
jgi:SAM-dependent methyltransferase